MEKYLLTYNRQSFRAASVSPCGAGRILDDMTFLTLSTAGKELLNGSIPPDCPPGMEMTSSARTVIIVLHAADS
jgi:hypothetical protein